MSFNEFINVTLCRAPHVTEGYFQNEEANADSFSDGWFRTGDVVVIDEGNNVFIVDRIKVNLLNKC